MLSNLCFLIVNSTLLLMLLKNNNEKEHIDLMFLVCLLFTFLGNICLGISVNTIIALINIGLGIKVFK